MPWKECQKMDEKLRFVSRHLEGESISSLCREFGISRVIGHKIVDRYRQNGLEAFIDRSRRPCRFANKLPFQTENLIVQIKKEYLDWGAPKIRERTLTHHPDIKTSAKSTVRAVLDRHGQGRSNINVVVALICRAHLCPWLTPPMSYGALTAKVSLCSAIGGTCSCRRGTDHLRRLNFDH